ncbi:MAG TPA: protein-L-isoaspartate(D-aspartate) O-methyltransferase [Rhizomicrobium sp.]|nr:protein-L-isoaspartate(D-aspartate) O-methyltransferase [Rhizomicrobium sp.]
MSDPRPAALVATLKEQGITDTRVLDAMEKTPRELFVEKPFEAEAYLNTALPIACGQTISQPFIVAYISQALDVAPKHRVLEIGGGSGYQAAVLAHLASRVYVIERHRPLLDAAAARFSALKLHNVVVQHGDGLKGWPKQAPFDRIVLSAAVGRVPEELLGQLKPGGILVAPVAAGSERFSQRLVKIIRTESGQIEEPLMPVVFVPMVPGLPQESRTLDGAAKGNV